MSTRELPPDLCRHHTAGHLWKLDGTRVDGLNEHATVLGVFVSILLEKLDHLLEKLDDIVNVAWADIECLLPDFHVWTACTRHIVMFWFCQHVQSCRLQAGCVRACVRGYLIQIFCQVLRGAILSAVEQHKEAVAL